MTRCPVCNHCGMCVSKQEVPTATAHGNGMISMDSNEIKEDCAFCAMPLDVLYN